jgi:hypothetical protein
MEQGHDPRGKMDYTSTTGELLTDLPLKDQNAVSPHGHNQNKWDGTYIGLTENRERLYFDINGSYGRQAFGELPATTSHYV